MSNSSSGRKKIKTNLPIAQEVLDRVNYDRESEYDWLKGFRDVELRGLGVTDEELNKIDSELQKLMSSDDTHVEIEFPASKLDKILKDGRFKSCFEASNGIGKGTSGYRKKREAAEDSMFRFYYSEAFDKRPVYGSATSFKTISGYSKYLGSDYEGMYGNVTAIFKPTVKSYSSVTFGDSIDEGRRLRSSPMLKPSYKSIMARKNIFDYKKNEWTKKTIFGEVISKVRANKKLSISDVSSRYAEVQIFGKQASVSNIQHLIFSGGSKPTAKQAATLKSLGITWSESGSSEIH